MGQIKLTITIDYSLKEIKEAYRKQLGFSKDEKVIKADIENWIAGIVDADLLDICSHDEEDV